mgnify:CR=1 FL=1
MSIHEVLQLYPDANLIVAGDTNVYLAEVMGSERERSGEVQLRAQICALYQDFGLVIANPAGIPTHRSGSCIDLVLASSGLAVHDLVVHDGATCGCSTGSCCPVLGSDHRLLTFRVALCQSSTDQTLPRWPVVRDWCPIVQSVGSQLSEWTAKLLRLRRDCTCLSVDARRATLDVLYSCHVVAAVSLACQAAWAVCAPPARLVGQSVLSIHGVQECSVASLASHTDA